MTGNNAIADADSLFTRIFRVNILTQHMNQQLWEEQRTLQRAVARRKREYEQAHWLRSYLPSFSVEDDEKLLHMISSQIQTNHHVIAWCQDKMQHWRKPFLISTTVAKLMI